MSVCIPKNLIPKLTSIDFSQNSVAREKQLMQFFDTDTAKEINKYYERSLLLKNQEKAFDRFLNNVTELGEKAKKEMRDKMSKDLQRRREIMFNPDGSINPDFERLLNRTDEDITRYTKEVFDRNYNLNLSEADASTISKIKFEMDDLAKKMGDTPNQSPERLAHASKQIELADYIANIINPEENLGFVATIKDILKKTGQRYEGKTSWEKVLETGKVTTEALTSAVFKSVQASIDFSMALRQGFKVLATNPKAWKENIIAAFEPFKNITTPKDRYQVLHGFKVKMAADKIYKQALDDGLAIGVVEEFFPTTLAEKIPGLGRLFKASNEAFTIFSQGSRMSLYKDMVENVAKNGGTLTKELSSELAMLANSITGRGNLGDFEKIPNIMNKIFFSGRFIKSQMDTFYLPFKPGLSPVARQVAMKSSMRTLAMFGSVMATASLFTDVETDPRSSKFGKMKVPGSKDTWVDISGGLGSYITLASRVATQSSKSSITGRINKLNTGEYGSQTAFNVVTDWLTNKLAPMPSTAAQYLKGSAFGGDELTIPGAVGNLITPISAGNAIELFQSEEFGPAFIATIADFAGAGQTDYTKFRK